MKMRNNRGPNTDPWGTPEVTVTVSDGAWSQTVYCNRWDRKLVIHAVIGPSPIMALSFEINLAWDTQSNAFVKSKRNMSV